MTTNELLIKAKGSCEVFNCLNTDTKNKVLISMAKSLIDNTENSLGAN